MIFMIRAAGAALAPPWSAHGYHGCDANLPSPLRRTCLHALREAGMSLRLKINLIVGALTCLFVAAVLALQLRSLRESVHEEVVAANRVAAQLLDRTAWRYAAQGTPAMLGFLQGVGRVRSNDITLFDAQGQELYRSPPSPYKAGRDAPAWFERLVEPAPSVQAIAFPDGKLEVRANASRATLDAWDEVRVLLLGAAALILVINTLVFWLVGRTVRPFGEIVRALDTLKAGRFDVALPPLAGTEAAAIGAAFNRMVGVLQQNLERGARALRQPRADALDRSPHRTGAQPDRARAARRTRPVRYGDAQHGAVDRATCAPARSEGRGGCARDRRRIVATV
jgi:HAMP domain-containing protein